MNETNTHETLAAIIAEMRGLADNRAADAGGERPGIELLRSYGDRIEAAVRSDIAAIRTALFRATEMLDQVYKHSGLTPSMRESIAEAVRDADAVLKGTPPPPKRFDEAAFDAAVSKPNGWSGVADPVAEIRRMRDGDAPGNAAAMRDALLYARNTLVLYSRDMKPRYQAEVGFMIDKCDAALAAPARNCDRFADATEMVRAFLKDPYSTQGRDSLVEVSHRFAEWAFAPAEGGDHA